MIPWPEFLKGFELILQWQIFVFIVLGMFLGLILGAIPGLTGGVGMAVLIPTTFLMEPLTALVFLTSIYSGSLTGGGITSILINTPGTGGAVATTFDGYPMTKKGLQNEALGIQISSSVVGGLLSYLFLLFLIHSMVKVALMFGPSEMLFLTIFVLIMISTIQGEYFERAFLAGSFGLLLGTVGCSDVTGVIRGTMGFETLEDGIPRIIIIMAMFAIPEMLDLITKGFITDIESASQQDAKKFLKGVKITFRYWRRLLKSAFIGIFIGCLPAAGASIASLLSYSQAKRSAKKHQRFGEGEPEGVVAAETANNGSEGGAMAVLLALGIPGSGAAAILMGAFMLHGLVPGPRLVVDYGPLVYGLIIANIFQMVVMGFCAFVLIFYCSRVVFVPTKILAPVLIIVMAIGAFGVRNAMLDISILFLFGIVGWFFRRYRFSPVNFIIGFILAGSLDLGMYQYVALFGNTLNAVITRPITGFFFLLSLGFMGFELYKNLIRKGPER